MVCCLINNAIGAGCLRLGYAFRSGIILSIIINFIFASLTYCVLMIFLRTGSYFKISTFDGIWEHLFGRKTVWISTFVSCIVGIYFCISYSKTLSSTLSDIIGTFVNSENLIKDGLTTGLLTLGVFLLPICYINKLKYIVVFCYIAIFCMFFFLVCVIYQFIDQVKRDGFDPNHQLAYFRFDSSIGNCIATFSTSYLIFPLAFPSFSHLKYSSFNQWKKIFLAMISFCFIYYSLMGIFCYLTYFDENEGGLIIIYYDISNALRIVYNIGVFLLIVFSVPMFMNPARFLLLNLFYSTEDIPHSSWFFTGVSIAFIGLVVAHLSDSIYNIITYITDAITIVVLFLIPSFLYLKTFGYSDKFYGILSTFLLLVGFALFAFIIYFDVA